MSHSSEELHKTPRTYNRTTPEADRLILQYLFGEDRFRDFCHYANQHRSILGSTNRGKTRVAVRNRKNYLRNEFLVNPRAIIATLYEKGLSPIAATVESRLEDFLSFHLQKVKSTPTKPIITSPTKRTTSSTSKKNNKVTLEAEDDSIHSDDCGDQSCREQLNFHTDDCGDQSCREKLNFGMSTSTHTNIPAVVQEYILDLKDPNMTQGNILPLLCKEVKGNGVSCDKLCLKLQHIDLMDYQARLYSARLAEDFASVLVTLPKLPTYERNRAEVEEFHKQQMKIAKAKATKGRAGWTCDAAYTSQLKIVTTYEEDNKQLLTTIQYHFPSNMTCNNKFFNDEADNEYTLIPKVVGFQRGQQLFASLILEMVIDGSVSHYGAKRVRAEADEVMDLIAGMSI